MKNNRIGCRIRLDGEDYYCSSFRTRAENMRGAWLKLFVDYGGEVPASKDEFLKRGGRVDWYRNY